MFRLVRFLAVLAVASIGLTGVVVAAAPQVSKIARSHEEKALAGPRPRRASPRRSIVYDNTGKNIVDIFKVENREPFKLSQVPVPVVNAILAVEDADFWKHNGVNGRSVMRALLANVASGSVEQGGSTITQQVVKNVIMNAQTDRTIKTKVVEAVLARRLEKKMGKAYVLEQYLNDVYFGNNAYGLQSAAEVYFGKNVDQLTMVEGAFLGGLIRNPTDYDPFVRPGTGPLPAPPGPGRAWSREHEITQAQALSLADARSRCRHPAAAAAAQRRPLVLHGGSQGLPAQRARTILGKTYQARYNTLFRGGLRIYTTQDLVLEQSAENARKEILPPNFEGFDARSSVSTPRRARWWRCAAAPASPRARSTSRCGVARRGPRSSS